MDEINVDKILDEIKKKIVDYKDKNINEAQTKSWFIQPFFESLGWDFSKPDEVIPEASDDAGAKPDYVFCLDEKPKLLIEAKSLSNRLDDDKMITNKLNYCNNLNVPLLIITNGDTYKIYYAELKEKAKDKLLEEFSISGGYDENIILKLCKESFQEDKLLNYAKTIFVATIIKNVVEDIFQSPEKNLISLVNTKIKSILGHTFGDADIKNTLNTFSIEFNIEDYETENIQQQNDNISDSKQTKYTIEDQFKNGKWGNSLNLYQIIISKLKYDKLDIVENPTKFYIGLISNDKNFCQIHGQESKLKIWLNLKLADLSEKDKLRVRDVSKIGHWGMGDIECIINNESDIEWIVSLIKISYNKTIDQA